MGVCRGDLEEGWTAGTAGWVGGDWSSSTLVQALTPATTRSLTPLMTNILPSAIGSDGRVNLFVGNVSRLRMRMPQRNAT